MDRLRLLWLLLGCPLFLWAQEPAVRDSSEAVPITIDYADTWEFRKVDTFQVQRLVGNVQLRKDTIFMWCDSAYIRSDNFLRAMGRVAMQQGDSIKIFADSVEVFQGLAELYGDVILDNRSQRLFTDRLDYDLNKRIGTYFSGGTLVNGEAQISSRKGYYYVGSQQMFFKDSVVVQDPRLFLRADTLGYNMDSERVTFLGPTRIQADSMELYCEKGFYNMQTEQAAFWQGAQFAKGEQLASADTIRYDGDSKVYELEGNAWFEEEGRYARAAEIIYNEESGETELIGEAYVRDEKQEVEADRIAFNRESGQYRTSGRTFLSDPPNLLYADQLDYDKERETGLAMGNVIWSDTSAQVSIFCETADYRQETGYVKASGGKRGRPYMLTLLDQDSLFLSADTLLSLPADTLSGDSARLMLAYASVRMFKSDMQGRCDSLVYNSQDSLFKMYFDPVLWSDTSQFTADTMHIQLANKQLDRVFLKNRGLILNSPDLIFFNQIQGRNITAFFREDELRRMEVSGNAMSVYYAMDDENAYVGVNKVICSDMNVFFGDNQVSSIHFLAEPDGEFLPMRTTNHEALRLEGFRWRYAERPVQFDDLFPTENPEPKDAVESKPELSTDRNRMDRIPVVNQR